MNTINTPTGERDSATDPYVDSVVGIKPSGLMVGVAVWMFWVFCAVGSFLAE